MQIVAEISLGIAVVLTLIYGEVRLLQSLRV